MPEASSGPPWACAVPVEEAARATIAGDAAFHPCQLADGTCPDKLTYPKTAKDIISHSTSSAVSRCHLTFIVILQDCGPDEALQRLAAQGRIASISDRCLEAILFQPRQELRPLRRLKTARDVLELLDEGRECFVNHCLTGSDVVEIELNAPLVCLLCQQPVQALPPWKEAQYLMCRHFIAHILDNVLINAPLYIGSDLDVLAFLVGLRQRLGEVRTLHIFGRQSEHGQ